MSADKITSHNVHYVKMTFKTRIVLTIEKHVLSLKIKSNANLLLSHYRALNRKIEAIIKNVNSR